MSQPALDKMIAIADAFDRGAFDRIDKIDTDTVATVVGLPSKSVSRLLNSLEVRRLTPAKLVKERHDRVYQYPPRIRLPDAKKIRQPEARFVVEAIADHRLPRRFNTALLYYLLGQSSNGSTKGPQGHLPRPLHQALLRSGFASHRPEGFKPKRIWQPATWAPPQDKEGWPAIFLQQRTLRRNGVRVSTIYRITDAAAGLGGIIQMAMEQLDLSRIPYDQQGALNRQVRAVTKDIYFEWLRAGNEARSAERQEHDQTVDWQSVAMLPDTHLRNFVRTAARVAASRANEDPPEAARL